MHRFACIALPEIFEELGVLGDLQPFCNSNDAGSPAGSPNVAGSPAAARSPNGARSPGARSSREPLPLGIVIARRGGPVIAERDLQGGTRLDAVSREAHRLGVRIGHTIATARSRCSQLRVRVVTEEAVQSVLESIAEVTLAFGPATSFDVQQNVVWVEIGGSAHLRGGEQKLARDLGSTVRALGHKCRIAIADGPRIAAAVARCLRSDSPSIVPAGEGAMAVRSLPMTALDLDDHVLTWLSELGFRTCGDLQKLPRRALGTRLGARTHDVLQMLDGEDRAPLDAWRPPQVPEERIELEWGISSIEALAFATKTLCDRLAARLQGRAMAAARIELALGLDRALCGDSTSSSTLEMVLPSPITRADDLHAVVRARLDRLKLTAPVLSATLRAPALERIPSRTLDLLTPEPRAAQSLPRLVAELAAILDPANVGTLELVDTWVPYERTRLVPFGAARASNRDRLLVTSALEPSRLVRPLGVTVESLASIEILARVEAVEWWRRGFTRHDMAAAWTVVGRAAGRTPASRRPDELRVDNRARALETTTRALAWVELASQSDKPTEVHVSIRGWID